MVGALKELAGGTSPQKIDDPDAFVFGTAHTSSQREPITLNIDKVSNGNIIITGRSQSGKTFTMKNYIRHIGRIDSTGHAKTVFVIDFSGDIGVENENVIKIKARKSEYGLSLFELTNKDRDSGGVDVRARDIVRMIDRYFMGSSMGAVQKSVLLQLVRDTYRLCGITEEDEESWENPVPTIDEFEKNLELVIETVETSISPSILASIKHARPKILKLEQQAQSVKQKIGIAEKIEDEARRQESIDKLSDKLSALEEQSGEIYGNLKGVLNQYLDYRIYGEGDEGDDMGFDTVFYGDKNAIAALKSLRPHIRAISKSGFNGKIPPIRPGVNRLDLSSLDEPMQKLFTDVLAQKVYQACRSRGPYRHSERRVEGWKFDTVLCIDEAKSIISESRTARESKQEPLNVIFAQSLKFGLACCVASQRVSHLTNEILSNAATKITFALGANDMGDLRTLYGLKPEQTNVLQKHGVGLVMFDNAKAIPVRFPHYISSR